MERSERGQAVLVEQIVQIRPDPTVEVGRKRRRRAAAVHLPRTPARLERGRRRLIRDRGEPTPISAHRSYVVERSLALHKSSAPGLSIDVPKLHLLDASQPRVELTRYSELDRTLPSIDDGWETSGAEGEGIVVYTGNWFASLSPDSGTSWVRTDQSRQRGPVDQTVQYAPQVERFIWVHLPSDGGELLISCATAEELNATNGESWTTWTLDPRRFSWVTGSDWWFDFPSPSVGRHFAYVATNVAGAGRSAIFRIPLAELANRSPIHVSSLLIDLWGLRAAQDIDDIGYFATHVSTSEMELWKWPETPGNKLWWARSAVPSFADTGYDLTLPDGTPWTADGDADILGASRRHEGEIWYAWTAGADRRFPYPYIRIAITDPDLRVIGSRYIWNDRFAYAWPDLASNGRGEVGLAFAWGGGKEWAHSGVGVVTSVPTLVNMSYPGVGAGGHYLTVRRSHPDTARFMAAVFWQQRDADGTRRNHPQYVQFQVT